METSILRQMLFVKGSQYFSPEQNWLPPTRTALCLTAPCATRSWPLNTTAPLGPSCLMIYSHIIPFISLRCWSINFQIYISLGTEDPGSWDRFLWLNPDRLSGLQMMGIHYCVAMADWLFLSQSAMANGKRQPLGTRFARMPKRFFLFTSVRRCWI